MSDESRVRTLADKILRNPKYVFADEGRANEVSDSLAHLDFSIPTWDYPEIYPSGTDFEDIASYFLVFNSINYCYFTKSGDRFEDKGVGGSTLLSTRLTKYWDEVKDPLFLSHIDENYLLGELFAAESPLPMIKQRVACLREVGAFLNTNASVSDLMRKLFIKYRSDAYLVSQVLPTLLPLWADPFYKRTQLFVGMVYGRFQNDPDVPIRKDSLDKLTVFADYRVPRSLFGLGILRASAAMRSSLFNKERMASGSRKELEIRAATIRGGDLLQKAFNDRHNKGLNSLHVDSFLWGLGRTPEPWLDNVVTNGFPEHHRTVTTDY